MHRRGHLAPKELLMTAKKWISAGILLVFVAGLAWLLIARFSSEADGPGHEAGSSSEASAAVARVERHDLGETLAISGAFKPFQNVDVHAKVAGYIKMIYVDVGDHVKAGQTIAVLEVPELAAQLAGADAAVRRATEEIGRAQGDLERAKSTHSAAHTAYHRLDDAAKTRQGLVAQQELDDSQAKDLESEAQVASAKSALSAAQQALEVAQANQKQTSAMSDYTHITAPFAGVITDRYADTGALIAAGTSSSTQAIPVVRLAQTSVLRLVLPIPESVAAQIRVGQSLKVHVQALNQDFEGKISRFADSLNEQTRTMETEIDFENSGGRLIAGMYAEIYFVHDQKKNALTVPLDAVLPKGELGTVLVVNSQNVVEQRQVKLGQEESTRMEILSGVNEGERVIVGKPGEFRPGQKVIPKESEAGSTNPAGDH
jgi:RND family efflux transporter MFP subunit